MALPVVAVVGRPNVGKSTLFNKLIGQRLSIVEDTPGVTRDRIYSKCEWRNREFMIVDTGGIEPDTDDVILAQMRRQAEIAIEKADVIVLVTDIRCGVTASDYAVITSDLATRSRFLQHTVTAQATCLTRYSSIFRKMKPNSIQMNM